MNLAFKLKSYCESSLLTALLYLPLAGTANRNVLAIVAFRLPSFQHCRTGCLKC